MKTTPINFALFILVIGIFLTFNATIRAQSALDGFDPNANGTIRTIAIQTDGKILIGGEFTTLSPNGGAPVTRNRIARLNADGTLDTAFNPNPNNSVTVFSMAIQSDGKILIGGTFSTLSPNGGAPITRNGIARLNADGTVDTAFDPNANGTVLSIVIQADGKILIGGTFFELAPNGGTPVTSNRIARLNADGTVDTAFDPNPNSIINSIVIQVDGKILIGGTFNTLAPNGGATITRNRIARLNTDGTVDAAFDPNANAEVYSIAVQSDGKILVGGTFGGIGGQTRIGIARLDPTTGLADSWNLNSNSSVRSIAVQSDGKVLAGGTFQSIGGQSRNSIARLDATTGLADSFNPNATGTVFSIAIQSNGKILIGGEFTTLSPNGGAPVTRNRIARLERNGSLDQTLNLNTVGSYVITTAVQPDGKIIIGGNFTGVLGSARNNIARLNPDGTLDTAFNPNANNEVYSIAIQSDGKILVGGTFTTISGQTRNRIARLNTDGTADSFDPIANNIVYSIAIQSDGKILVGGGFTTIGGQARNFIARLNTDGTADSFNPNANNIVYSIAIQSDGKVLVGGVFTSIGGQARNFIARLNTDGTADSFDSNANNHVYSIAIQSDGKILVGGLFTTIGGQARNYIARLNTDGTADSFNPNANNSVLSIAIQSDGKILVGGTFTTIGGQTRNRIARLNTDGTADSFNPNANNHVYSIAIQSDGKILVGGLFTTIGGQSRNRFARLSNDTAALQNLAVSQTDISWTLDGASPVMTRVEFEQSTDGVNFTPLGSGTPNFAAPLAEGSFFKNILEQTGGVFDNNAAQFAPLAPQMSGWTLTGLNLPTGQNIYIRARGFYRSGYFNGSENITETVQNIFFVDPTPPELSIGDVSQAEGNAGTTDFTFTVTLSEANSSAVTVDYATADGTAIAGQDYTAGNGTLTFAPGELTKTITVQVGGDTTVELNENFFVNLTSPTNSTILDGQGVGTIQNDDVPTLSINDVSQTEGNAGTSTFAFTIMLSQASPLSISVDYQTADGTASAGSDYLAIPATTVTLAPGETTKIVNVSVVGDTTVELNETFFVNLSNATNSAITDNQGLGTIQNDDAPTLSINDVSQIEGNAGTSTFAFTVTLSQASPQTVAVDYATADNSATVAGNDYLAASGTLTFAPGDLTKTVNVTVNGDTLVELDETFFVNLTNPSNATVSDGQGPGTIQNDDVPTLSVNDVSLAEGNSGTTDFTFTVTLSQASPLSVAVDYATADGTATVAGNDYSAIPTTTVTFAPGELTKTISVSVTGDTLVELDETFFVNLTNPSNATIADNQGLGTIQNDDIPTLSINDVSQVEGDAGTSNFVFTVTLSQASPAAVTVDYQTADGTATVSNNDYVAANGTLTFAPGDLTKTITVQVNGDNTFEFDETFFVALSNPTNATVADGQGTGTILNDDSQSLRIKDVRVWEGNSGTSIAAFTVTLTADLNRPEGNSTAVTVDYATSNGTAQAGSDYVAASGTLTFQPGETEKTVEVTINGDLNKEANETFFVTLSNAVNAGIADASGVGIIVDEDRAFAADFDNDKRTDYSVYRPSTHVWYILQSSNGIPNIITFGQPGDVIAPGDYDGDGITDRAFYRAVEGVWYILQSSNAALITKTFGLAGDRVVQGDYDGDSKTDTAIYRPSTGTWWIQRSSNNQIVATQFGNSTDIPVVGDYDGDARADLAVYRNGVWFVLRSSDGAVSISNWGIAGDRPVSGDFDGDGSTDIAIYRDGVWWIRESLTGEARVLPFGLGTDIPTVGDYDGDGTSDVAVFRPSTGDWYVLRSSDSELTGVNWGLAGDSPLQAAYQPQ